MAANTGRLPAERLIKQGNQGRLDLKNFGIATKKIILSLTKSDKDK